MIRRDLKNNEIERLARIWVKLIDTGNLDCESIPLDSSSLHLNVAFCAHKVVDRAHRTSPRLQGRDGVPLRERLEHGQLSDQTDDSLFADALCLA